jgi:hypothetical protein
MMAVYVDEIRKYGYGPKCLRDGVCHMTADTEYELHVMARRIGMKPQWFQPGITPHYDLTPSRRALAMQYGALFKPGREQARERLRQRGLIT